MAVRIAREYVDVMEQHAERLRRLTDQRGAARLKKIYDAAYRDTHARLRGMLRAGMDDTFTAYQHRVVLAQLKMTTVQLNQKLIGELRDTTKEAQVEAVQAFGSDMNVLEETFSGAAVPIALDETVRLNAIVQKRRAELDSMHQKALTKWGTNTFEKINESLVKSMAQQDTTDEAIEALPEAADREWWQGERIVRTETAWAYNSATHDSVEAILDELPDMRLRWTELVDDSTGQPLDDRVGADSIAMHGQIAAPGEGFTMPDDPDVSDSLIGRTWIFPPNRPNDRSRLLPWRPHWGIPGWTYSGGRRVPA